jgi:hypothetical protein
MRNTLHLITSFFFFCGQTLIAQVPAVSAEEALTLAKQIETGMNSGDASVLHNLFDVPSFAAILGEKSEAAKTTGFMEGFLTSFTFKTFGDQTLKHIRNGSFRMLRSFEKDGQRHLLFRVFGTGGLNYYDFLLVKVKDSVKPADVLPYITGDLMTSTVAAVIDLAVNGTKDMSQLSSEMAAIVKMKNEKLQGNFQAVKESFDKLDIRYQQSKIFQVIYRCLPAPG